MFTMCALWEICYHLHNFKKVKKPIEAWNLQLYESRNPPCFSRFLNCTNGIKSRKASYIWPKTPVTAFFHIIAIHKIVGDRKRPSDTLTKSCTLQ